MNKSLLEILEEEKRALRNVENFKYSKDGILEMAKSETESPKNTRKNWKRKKKNFFLSEKK